MSSKKILTGPRKLSGVLRNGRQEPCRLDTKCRLNICFPFAFFLSFALFFFFNIRTSNFVVEAETKVDVLFLFVFFFCFEPETFLNMLFWKHERIKCNQLLSGSLFTVVVGFFFSANSLYCSSTVENDKKLIA